MRAFLAGLVLSVAVLAPKVSNAQVYQLPNSPPTVTAAGASWQVNGEPVFYAGDWYYPAGATVYFDGNTMVRVGTYLSVPLYADATLEPYSIVYVPIGGTVMRPYERRREGELVGTVGSRTPSFPIQRDVEVSARAGRGEIETLPPRAPVERPMIAEMPATVATSGSIVPLAPAPSIVTGPPQPTYVQSIPRPQSNAGIWIQFDGTRWYSAGTAVPYSDRQFVKVGDLDGFPVYRDRSGPHDQIYVESVAGGPVAPYKRR